jgi:hypothetical protein
MFMVKAFPADARVLIVGQGTWDVAEALRFKAEVAAVLTHCGRTCGAVRMLADLTEHHLQCSRVSEVNAETAQIIKDARIERYALAVPGALLRLQARRLLCGVNFSMFANREDAAAWLDWPLDDLARDLQASRGDRLHDAA